MTSMPSAILRAALAAAAFVLALGPAAAEHWPGLVPGPGQGAGAGAGARRPARAPDIFFAPTWEPVVYEMLDLAGVTRDDVVYDLGSGDGRIVILAAQKFGCRGVGIELDPKLVAASNQVARAAGLQDLVRFIEGDLFTADISAATVVTLYLSTAVNRDLEPRLRRELAPGTRIVSHQFPIGNWPPDRRLRSKADGTDLFLWTVRSGGR
jgi:SAM-dependent methyltransferase